MFPILSAFLALAVATKSTPLSSTGLLGSIEQIIHAATNVNSSSDLTSFLGLVTAGTTPASISQAVDAATLALNRSNNDPIAYAGLLKQAGLLSSLNPVTQQLSGCGHPCTDRNVNTREPKPSAYTRASGDAPWSVSEQQLRAALYFPPQYTYGSKTPIIFVPGTGNYGKQSFSRNMGKKFSKGNIADPVYLNVPEYILNDAQVSGEYVAYAAKYVSGVSKNRKVAIMTWSQGSLDTHWAMKYWPSARNKVADVINISGDYKGTAFVLAFCALGACSESLWQQNPPSKFISTLRANGGDSAYVPTTSIMSLTDNIVPQLGGMSASGYINDARNVGVSNNFIQEICLLQPGGIPYTHEGAMFSNLAFDLAVDAITHDGPGRVERLDRAKTCSFLATQGLDVADIVFTEGATPQAIFNILTRPGVAGEPPIKAYAQ